MQTSSLLHSHCKPCISRPSPAHPAIRLASLPVLALCRRTAHPQLRRSCLAHEQHPERQGRSLGAATPSRPRNRAESRPVASRSKALSVELVSEQNAPHARLTAPQELHCSLRLPLTPVFSHDLRFTAAGQDPDKVMAATAGHTASIGRVTQRQGK